MEILIDNQDLKTFFGIDVLDYTPALSIASERVNEREWNDKSGVDKNRANVRYDAREFVLSCIINSSNESTAYELAKTLTDYMFLKGVFVLSLRDSAKSIRQSFLCERSNTVVPSINIREQNSIFIFQLGLKDINPNALKFATSITANEVSISYTKGQNAAIYWGDGSQGLVSNSGTYTKSDYVAASGDVDVFIDVDSNASTVTSLVAQFSADVVSGSKALDVQFTDTSTGAIIIWSWDFGDGFTSALQNPSHTYSTEGTYTVTLRVFNDVQGSAVETKINYITVTNSIGLINDAGDQGLINATDKGLIN